MILIIGRILCHLIFAFKTRSQLRALPRTVLVAGEPGNEAASAFVSFSFQKLYLNYCEDSKSKLTLVVQTTILRSSSCTEDC